MYFYSNINTPYEGNHVMPWLGIELALSWLPGDLYFTVPDTVVTRKQGGIVINLRGAQGCCECDMLTSLFILQCSAIFVPTSRQSKQKTDIDSGDNFTLFCVNLNGNIPVISVHVYCKTEGSNSTSGCFGRARNTNI